VPGAIPRGDTRYRGLVSVDGGSGSAKVLDWGPSHAVVSVEGATPGALLRYDMNYDPSWSANGVPALAQDGLVAAPLRGGSERVELRYFPRTFRFSVPLCLLTLLACLWQSRWNRFLRRIFRSKPE
jgi:hypothetical protein